MESNSLNIREDAAKELTLMPIDQRYLLVLNIKSSCDSEGNRYLEPLWAKDLIEHFKYLKNFTLASPQALETPPENSIEVDSETSFADAKFVDLPSPNSLGKAILLLPATVAKLWGAIASSDIVHSGVAGWPIPMAWLVTPIVLIQRKPYLLVVESAPWRLTPGTPASIKAKIMAYIFETLYGHGSSETGSQPDSPRNAPAAVAAFVKNVGAIKKVGDTYSRAIAPSCQIGTT